MKDAKNRKKVTLEWNRDDLLKVVASSFEEGTPYKWIDFPQPNYASTNADVLMKRQANRRHLDVQRLLVQRALHALARRGRR